MPNYSSAQDVTIGPKIGFNIGAPLPLGNIPEGAKGTPLACHNLGVFVNYKISEKFSIQAEILYNRKGAHFTTPLDSMSYTDHMQHPLYPDVWLDVETFFNGTAEGAFDNYYLEFPLLLSYKIGQSKWSLMVGGYYGWLAQTETHATATGYVGYDPALREEVLDFAENTREYDYGALIGTTYKASDRIDINIRISFGMESVFVDDYEKIDYSLNNMFAQFTASYSFIPANWFTKK
ncbi:MAG: hypothetical protein A2W93_06335 [Bacteroidetes bacterium GWF2_43_63]|nr:MAG: hypothetical protein A2W94_08200 [Bacteroidetes bacterium GWE2_42_42]OFY53238.1 MAG: hypothetical protein A2W93_06335 [Bacteroidetes bacterium GWF2_43_63]